MPKGAAPPDGFPIVALGRPVTGTGRGCTSSSTAVVDPSPTVEALLQASYVVVVPDYLGLGRPSDGEASFHPFLDSATDAENMIDAVRATRNAVPQASTSWVALGTGQGGQAAWAANEMADTYGWGLNLLGTASISPTADIEGLADAAAAGTLTTQQRLAYIAYLDATATLRGYLRKTNLPQAPTLAPMLVVFGTRDPLIPAEWTQRALDRACGMGDVIAIQKLPDDSPAVIDPTVALGWIAGRFAHTSAPNDCAPVSTANPRPVGAADASQPPPAPPAAQPAHGDAGARSPGTSLISGWLPIAIQSVAFAVLLAAIGWRSRRWRLRWLPAASVVGVTVAACAYWYVDYQGWGHDQPWGMWAWIALTGLAIAVVVVGWPSASWWRRTMSILAVPLAAVSAATVLNMTLGYLPTAQTAWEMATNAQPPNWIDQSQLAAMVRDGARPTRGTIVSVEIPDDWLEAGDGLRILDEFALKHRGMTPVGVFPDSSGAFANDTECVNGVRGNAADHLTKAVVPYVISHFGVSAEPSNWGLVGWSAGGTCALTLAVMHPELFSAFVDLDGQLGPNAGSKEQTIARLFGGDAEAWAGAANTPIGDPPADWMTFSEDHANTADQLCQLLSGHGIDCAVSSYSGSHDFPSAANGLAAELPWLAAKIGTPGVPREPLPGAPLTG